ncbi:MAG: phosphatase PAP2 family protein [Agriterribacter sp.]
MKKRILFIVLLFPCLVNAQNIDIDILKSINPSDPSSTYWGITSSSAYFIPAGIAAGTLVYGMIKKNRKVRQRAYELGISVGVGSLFTQTLKFAIDRKRPAEKYPDEVFPAQARYGHSFPSGHTTLAFATATTISLQYRKWYITVPAYVWAASVGYSRMYRGVHYPSDVLAGAVIGVGSGLLSHWLTNKLIRDKKR